MYRFTVYMMNFNPRLREGGDGIAITRQYDKDDFNPRLREGGDQLAVIGSYVIKDFNPRLREGGDNHFFNCF